MGQSISRTQAREVAVCVVFSGALADRETLELALDGKTAGEPELNFINKILTVVRERQTEIDEKIEPNLKGWTLERLPKTDLAVLRVAVAEFLIGETARAVIINEGVAIAKKFGQNNGDFINGILGKITV
jgi:N utilization substance protein B